MTAIASASTSDSAYALRGDGTVWAWGFNQYGQVGNGSTGLKVATPVQVGTLDHVVRIGAGKNVGFAVRIVDDQHPSELWA